MTAWSPVAVADFCRKAGWTSTSLQQATAIALAASQGDDAYDYGYAASTLDDYKGLFGIPLSLIPSMFKGNLFDPLANAKLAYSLWRRGNRSWDWSPYYRSGAWRTYLTVAKDAISAPPTPQETPGITGATRVSKGRQSMDITLHGGEQRIIDASGWARIIPSR